MADHSDVLLQFVDLTGADIEVAQSLLESNNWDLDLCVTLYLEGGMAQQAPSASTPAKAAGEPVYNPPPEAQTYIDEDTVRAPIMPKQEVLVEEDPYMVHRRQMANAHRAAGFAKNTPQGVFEMFGRDFKQEGKASKNAKPETDSQKKLKTLADLFRPPLELIEPGSFEDVKNKAFARKKWLLVNIQAVTEFDCQKLNRDTWSDAVVKSIVAEGFVLWQVLQDGEEGSRYCRFYPVHGLPHISVIDSRTGERLLVLEGFVDAAKLKAELTKFQEAHHFEDVNPASADAAQERRKLAGDLSEEEEVMAAIAASLDRGETLPEAPAPPIETHTPLHHPSSSSSSSLGGDMSVTSPPLPKTPPPTPIPSIDPAIKEAHSTQTPELTCTIQIRTPSGNVKGFFKPTDTVNLVHQYTALHMEPGTAFTLCTSFPKRAFTGDMLNQSLQQAELAPRAMLICEKHN